MLLLLLCNVPTEVCTAFWCCFVCVRVFYGIGHTSLLSSDALISALLSLQAIEEDYARSEANLNHAKNKPNPDMQLESKLACNFALAYMSLNAHHAPALLRYKSEC